MAEMDRAAAQGKARIVGCDDQLGLPEPPIEITPTCRFKNLSGSTLPAGENVRLEVGFNVELPRGMEPPQNLLCRAPHLTVMVIAPEMEIEPLTSTIETLTPKTIVEFTLTAPARPGDYSFKLKLLVRGEPIYSATVPYQVQ